MKSILSAARCTAALAFALPAMAQTDTSKPVHKHHQRTLLGQHGHHHADERARRPVEPVREAIHAWPPADHEPFIAL